MTWHIGRVAALSGHSVHTIRWYEAQGLIPGVERDRGGRRVYLQATSTTWASSNICA